MTKPAGFPGRLLPPEVITYLRESHEMPARLETLGGMSRSDVYRIHLPRGSLILKLDARPNEAHFYESIAPHLPLGRAIPGLYRAGCSADRAWLLLEDIPHPLPRARWLADKEALTVLRQLHLHSLEHPLDLPNAFRPSWNSAMTDMALSNFPTETAVMLRPVLERLAQAAQQLFRPLCAISGDPNPSNWGVRHDGTLALFDWERFGRGTPTLDLAITVPGLGDEATYRAVAAGYLAGSSLPCPFGYASSDQLARDIVRAKAWAVTEFLAAVAEREVVRSPSIDWLLEHVPRWLVRLGSEQAGEPS